MKTGYLCVIGLICLCLGLSACDVAHSIVVKNKTPEKARLYYSVSRPNFTDTAFTISLAPRKSFSIFYYFGNWNDTEMKRVAHEFRRIELASVTDTVVLANYEQIHSFLASRRLRLLFNNHIIIKIK